MKDQLLRVRPVNQDLGRVRHLFELRSEVCRRLKFRLLLTSFPHQPLLLWKMAVLLLLQLQDLRSCFCSAYTSYLDVHAIQNCMLMIELHADVQLCLQSSFPCTNKRCKQNVHVIITCIACKAPAFG